MSKELLRIVDSIHREKEIDKEILFTGIESALLATVRRRLELDETVALSVTIDRQSGEIHARNAQGERIPIDLGRIAAQAAKQVIIQKIREAERDVIFNEYEDKRGLLISGQVQRFEGPNLVVNLGHAEGILPTREQVSSESYRVGDRVRAYVTEVKKIGPKVKIFLSRTHPELVRRLFEIEVPEIHDGVIEIVALAREPGHRTKIAVRANDSRVDCVGSCIGVRGARIRNVTEELGGEKIDIVPYSEDLPTFIASALKPAEVGRVLLEESTKRARVIVAEDQLSLAIGKRGQNVRLASRLAKWEIDIMTQGEYEVATDKARLELSALGGMDERRAAALAAAGINNLEALVSTGAEALAGLEGLDAEAAAELARQAVERLEALNREAEAAARAREAAEAAGAAPESPPGAPGA